MGGQYASLEHLGQLTENAGDRHDAGLSEGGLGACDALCEKARRMMRMLSG